MSEYPVLGTYKGMDGNDTDFALEVLSVDPANDKIVILDYPFAERAVISLTDWQYYLEEHFLEYI